MDCVCPTCGAELPDVACPAACLRCGRALPAEIREQFERDEHAAEELSHPRASDLSGVDSRQEQDS